MNLTKERMGTYNDSFEVDDGPISFLVMVKNGMSKLRHIMARIALSRDVKVPFLIFRKPLQPIHQEGIIILGCAFVTTIIIIRRSIRV